MDFSPSWLQDPLPLSPFQASPWGLPTPPCVLGWNTEEEGHDSSCTS